MSEKAMRDEKAMADTDQCTATARSTGERCKQPAIDGSNVCRYHGGSTSHIKEKAQERLDRMADEMLAEFEPRLADLFEEYDAATDPSEKVKLLREIRQSVTDVLDRADHGPTQTHEHTGDDGGSIAVTVDFTDVDT